MHIAQLMSIGELYDVRYYVRLYFVLYTFVSGRETRNKYIQLKVPIKIIFSYQNKGRRNHYKSVSYSFRPRQSESFCVSMYILMITNYLKHAFGKRRKIEKNKITIIRVVTSMIIRTIVVSQIYIHKHMQCQDLITNKLSG